MPAPEQSAQASLLQATQPHTDARDATLAWARSVVPVLHGLNEASEIAKTETDANQGERRPVEPQEMTDGAMLTEGRATDETDEPMNPDEGGGSETYDESDDDSFANDSLDASNDYSIDGSNANSIGDSNGDSFTNATLAMEECMEHLSLTEIWQLREMLPGHIQSMTQAGRAAAALRLTDSLSLRGLQTVCFYLPRKLGKIRTAADADTHYYGGQVACMQSPARLDQPEDPQQQAARVCDHSPVRGCHVSVHR